MKIGILYEVSEDSEEYPGENLDDTATRKKRKRPKLDREEVFAALEKLDHEPAYIELDGRDASLFALGKSKTDLIFNLVEGYGGDDTKDLNIPAFLELVGLKYTGSGPHGPLPAKEKSRGKKIFAFTGLPTPFSAGSLPGKLDYSPDVSFR